MSEACPVASGAEREALPHFVRLRMAKIKRIMRAGVMRAYELSHGTAMMARGGWRFVRTGLILAIMAAIAVPVATPATATPEASFAASLGGSERRTFEAYIAARRFYNLTLNEFWSEVEEKRAVRRKRRAADQLERGHSQWAW